MEALINGEMKKGVCNCSWLLITIRSVKVFFESFFPKYQASNKIVILRYPGAASLDDAIYVIYDPHHTSE